MALMFSLIDILLYEPLRLTFFGLSFTITAIIAILLFYSGGFGGADSKALMCIALALPFLPDALFSPLLPGGISPLSQMIFPLTVFSNGVLFAAATGLYMLLYNVIWHKKSGRSMFEGTLARESLGKRIMAIITGHKIDVTELEKKWHIYPMEDIDEENNGNQVKRYLSVIPRDEGRDEIVERLSNAVKSGRIDPYVWATPGLPMLIFITLGLIASLLFGDIVWVLVTSVLG